MITEIPAPHVVEEMAFHAMWDALMINAAAKRVGSTYSVSMHPKTHGEWKALIRMADQELYPGCVQRQHVSGDLFVTRIYGDIEDACKDSTRDITVFDWC